MEILDTYVHKGRELHIYALEEAVAVNGASEGTQAGDGRPCEAGGLKIDGLRVEPAGDGLTLTATVTGGPDLAYLFTEVLIKDSAHDRYYGPMSREYVRAERNEGSSGITRPDWDDPVELSVKMKPRLRLATDGANQAFCFSFPEGYSSVGYRQGTIFTPAAYSESSRALLGFSGDGSLRRAVAYYSEGDRRTGARVLTPGEGDRFAPLLQVFNPDGAGGWTITSAVGDTLTLGSWPLRAVVETPFAGDYLVGIMAQAQDGGLCRQYVPMHLSN